MITWTSENAEKDPQGKIIYRKEGRCISTDDKPVDVANGSILMEMDTSKVWMFDYESTTWLEWGGNA